MRNYKEPLKKSFGWPRRKPTRVRLLQTAQGSASNAVRLKQLKDLVGVPPAARSFL